MHHLTIGSTRLRQVLVLGMSLYGIVSLRSETFRCLDALNLAIHETGHLVFTPLGEVMHFLGGTLLQLALPLLFAGSFFRRGDRFAAYVVCWWAAQNLWNISVYMRDARSQSLPLVGGGEHDWGYLLGRLDLLQHDQTLGGIVHLIGVLIYLYAIVQGFYYARVERPAEALAA